MKKNEESPTPLLGKPRVNGKIFTYSENQLLDQITTEIMHAWAKDLNVIKNTHKKSLQVVEQVRVIHDLIEEKFPKLQEFIMTNEFIEDFTRVKSNIEFINLRLAETNKSILELNEKINFSYVKSLLDGMKTIDQTINSLKTEIDKINKRKWWHRFFANR